eukprot:COSAG01_NODE_70826_length_257_cov_1.316456_1_plen_29_part_10
MHLRVCTVWPVHEPGGGTAGAPDLAVTAE